MPSISEAGFKALPLAHQAGFRLDPSTGQYMNDPAPSLQPNLTYGYDQTANEGKGGYPSMPAKTGTPGVGPSPWDTGGMGGALEGLFASMGGRGASVGSGYGGGTGGGQSATIAAPSIPGPVSGGATVPHVAHVDTSEAQRAAFARAKDQTGEVARGALTGLRSALGGAGGAGFQRTAGNIAARGLGELGNVSRQQAIESAGLAEREGNTNYTGDIAQRGQSIGEAQSNANRAASTANTGYEGQIQQRGQDIAAQQANARMQMEAAQAQQAQQQSALAGLLKALGPSAKRVY